MFLETLILEFPNFFTAMLKFCQHSFHVAMGNGGVGGGGGKVKGRNSMQCVFTVTQNSMIKLLASLYSMGLGLGLVFSFLL